MLFAKIHSVSLKTMQCLHRERISSVLPQHNGINLVIPYFLNSQSGRHDKVSATRRSC